MKERKENEGLGEGREGEMKGIPFWIGGKLEWKT